MDYREVNGVKTGGSDGCINYADADNAGLSDCAESSGLVQAYQSVCDKVSFADFLVIAGEAIMGRTASLYNPSDYYATGTLA